MTRYVYDNEDILLELDSVNNITARYTHGPGIDEPLIMEKGGQSFFYHADGLGSITEITNQSGSVVQSYTYSSFGKIESQLDPNFIQPYTFTAREFDPETGLHFYRNRTLDPTIGRFNQQDPVPGLLRVPQSLNRCLYVRNNAVNFVDPLGLQQQSANPCRGSTCNRGVAECYSNCVLGLLPNPGKAVAALGALGAAFGIGSTPLFGGVITAAEVAGGYLGGLVGALGAGATSAETLLPWVAGGAAAGAGTLTAVGIGAAAAAGYVVGVEAFCLGRCFGNSCSF